MKKDKKKPITLKIEENLTETKQFHSVDGLKHVYFPYEPYEEQVKIIKCIHQSIHGKENALIQSPTGTGKTLCLLIGAISALLSCENSRHKIYYLTRTHSQISQIVKQLQKTVYDCRVNIIASRDQLCVNKNFSQLKGKVLEKACGALCAENACIYKSSMVGKVPKLMEMQQFKQFCKKDLICPYFYSKQIIDRCEITIMPFNYLLDWNLFQKNHFQLKDAIVIFDQAHNIDTISQQGSTIDISADLIYLAATELKGLMKVIRGKYLHEKFAISSMEIKELQQIKCVIDAFSNSLKKCSEIKYISRNQFLESIEKITSYVSSDQFTFNEGLDLGNYHQFCSKCRKVVKLFYKKEMQCQSFQNLINLIEKMFSIASRQKQFALYSASIVIDSKQNILRLRCLDPSVSFQRIFQAHPRSLILSSGTLGCLNRWERSLKREFKYKLNISSFIHKTQLYAAILPRSQEGIRYDFSFQKKHFQIQYQSLIRELQRIQSIVSNGIIVAFSTYQLMEKTLKYSKILKKKVFYQSKGSDINEIYKSYSELANSSGAFLFIIIKGRFSQGINFSDKLCRCLLIVGIPYLPMRDATVIDKMAFISDHQNKEEAQKWYTNQTFKAINQTIGRVIRNKNDFGVVILVDQRYERQDVISEFPVWFKSCLRPPSNLYNEIELFFKREDWKNSDKVTFTKVYEESNPYTKFKPEQPTLQKLIAFSTPSKTNKKKKLNLIEDKQQKAISALKGRENNKEIDKQNEEDHQIIQKSYMKIKKSLGKYFTFDFELPSDTNEENKIQMTAGKQPQIIAVNKRFNNKYNCLDF